MNNLRKLTILGVTLSMLLWVAGPVIPVAKAAIILDGDLVRVAGQKAVYLIQGSYARVFPHQSVYHSWGYPADYSTVKIITAAELAAYSTGNPVPFRDGSLFRGLTSSLYGRPTPTVFYVENTTLRPIISGTVYKTLFNDPTYSKVVWVPTDLLDKFAYPIGSTIESAATYPSGLLVKYGDRYGLTTSDGKVRYFANDNAITDNRYKKANAVTIATALPESTSITGKEDALLAVGWTSVAAGSLVVSLAADNPSALTVADGAANVNLLKVRLTAGISAVTVTGLKFKRTDVGAANEWDSLYLYEDDTRITASGRILNNDHEVEFLALAINVPANSSKTITLRGDVNAANSVAGSRHAFNLTAITTSATVTGLPLAGNVMTIGSQEVGTVTISRGSMPSNPMVGAKEAEVLQFKIANTSANQDVTFNQVVFTFSGTVARANVTNLKLFLIGETSALTTATAINSNDTVTLTLSTPYTILKGATKTFVLKADLDGKVDETLSFYMDQSSHLVVVDKQYGVGAAVSIDDNINEASDTSLTLRGGTITLADNGPLAGKIGKNQNDVVLTKFSMTASRDVEVRRLKVTLGPTSNISNEDGDISDLRIKDLDTGQTLMSTSVNLDDTWDTDYTLVNAFNLSAGVTRNLAITADLGSDVDGDFTDKLIKADLSQVDYGSAGQVYIYDLGTGQYLNATDVVPNNIYGDNQQIVASDLSFALASTPVSSTFVKGATNVDSLGVIFTAADASDITIRQIKFRVYATQTSGNYTNSVNPAYVITALKLYDGSTLLGTKTISGWTETLDYGTATFDGLNVIVTKGTNKKLTVKADVSNSLDTNTWYYVALEGGDEHTTAYDVDGNSVDINDGDDVNTNRTVEITITTGGTLTMALDGDTPAAGLAVAGTSNVAITKVKFTANNENFTINKLTVANSSTTYDRAIAAVKLSYPGGSAVGYLASGSVTFTGLNWVVEKDASEVLTISADLNTIAGGAVSGDEIKLNITCAAADKCEAVGTSGTVLGDGVNELSDITTGNITYLRKTVPTVTLASGSASGTFVPGWTELGTFSIAADAAGDLELAKIQWTLETNGTAWKNDLTVSDFQVYDTNNLSNDLTDDTGVTVTYTASTGVFAINWDNAYRPVIAHNSSKSYLLKVDTLSSEGLGYAIDQGLSSGVDAVVRAYINIDTVSASGVDADLVWDDEVNTSYATINGFGVRYINPLYGNSRIYDR